MQRLKALVLAGAFCSLLAPAASAAYDCDTVVVDQAEWFGSSVETVARTANELIKQGSDVRVMTIRDFGSFGTLDAYKADVQNNCASWRAPDGGMKNNLVVFMAEVGHRKVGIYFGDLWRPAFANGAEARIQSEAMTPRFRDGNFAGGFVAGMQQVGQLVNLQLHPPANNSGPIVIDNRPTVDYSGVWKWLLGILFLVLAFISMFVFTTGKRKTGEARRTAQRGAQTEKTGCVNMINGFDLTVLTAKANRVAAISSPADAASYKQKLASLEAAHANASAEFSRLDAISSNDPSRDELSPSEYDQIGKTYAGLKQKLDALERSRVQLDRALDQVQADAAEAPARIETARSAIASAKTSIGEIAKSGFKTDAAEAIIANAGSLLDQAGAAHKAKQLGSAAKLAKDAAAKAAEATATAVQLPNIKSELDSRLAALNKRVSSVAALVKNTKPVFAAMSAEYVEESWTNIQGNGTEAEKRIQTANKAATDAAKALSMEEQRWENAEHSLDTASAKLDEAENLLTAIMKLSESLVQAKGKAAEEIAAAQADINKAKAYIREHRDEIEESLTADLKRASSMLVKAGAEMDKEKPNYLQVVKLALAANQAADTIYASAKNMHEATVRLQRQAASIMEEAKRSIDEAARYIGNHTKDVDSDAEHRLERARVSYEAARRANTLDDQVRQANEADQNADEALRMAKRDVADVEEEIRRRREERESKRDDGFTTGVVIGSILNGSGRRDDHWGSSPKQSDSGSSSGFGDSSSGHGSSIGFGESSSGGGSSSSW